MDGLCRLCSETNDNCDDLFSCSSRCDGAGNASLHEVGGGAAEAFADADAGGDDEHIIQEKKAVPPATTSERHLQMVRDDLPASLCRGCVLSGAEAVGGEGDKMLIAEMWKDATLLMPLCDTCMCKTSTQARAV